MTDIRYQIIKGRKYDKLVTVDGAGSQSAVAFIDRETSVYYWAASWSKRAYRMPRENVAQYAAIVAGI